MVSKLVVWLGAIRAPLLMVSVISVTLGAAVAYNGAFNSIYFLLTLFAVLFLQIGINLSNDYFDHVSGVNGTTKRPTPFSGGSRVIQEKLLSPNEVFYAALVSFAISLIIGVKLIFEFGWVVLFLGFAMFFLGYLYTAKPFRLVYRGLGELSAGIIFGPFAVLLSYYIQAQALSLEAFLVSLPIGILVMALLLISEFPDFEADKKSGKKTLVVRLGQKKAAMLFLSLVLSTYILTVAFSLLGLISLFAVFVLLVLPVSTPPCAVTMKFYDKIEPMSLSIALTALSYIFFGLVLIIVYMIV